MKMQKTLFSIAGIILLAAIVVCMTKSATIWHQFTVNEGLNIYTEYSDIQNNRAPAPTSYPFSKKKTDDVKNYNLNNYDITYHSLDLRQYVDNPDILDSHGNLDTTQMADLFTPVALSPRPKEYTYTDSVIYGNYSK